MATTGSKSTSKTQADIREVISKINNRKNNQHTNTSRSGSRKTTPFSSKPQATILPNVKNAVMEPSDSFAHYIFFNHTNIEQIVLERYGAQSEEKKRIRQLRLYSRYVQSPIERISDPFHVLRFDSPMWEGLFRMAIKCPLPDYGSYRDMVRTLSNAGINKLCFVNMSRDNIVFQDQRYVITKLQTQFNNWSGKLRKLPKYLQSCQINREKKLEIDRDRLRQHIKHHSNLKANWHSIAHFEDRILSELLGPKERRTLFLWHSFAFEDNALNRKYHVGKYFHLPEGQMPMQALLEKIAPIEIPSRREMLTIASLRRANASSSSSINSSENRNTSAFMPYASSTQNSDVRNQSRPVTDASFTSTNSNSSGSTDQENHDNENIRTNNIKSRQLPSVDNYRYNTEKVAPPYDDQAKRIQTDKSSSKPNNPTSDRPQNRTMTADSVVHAQPTVGNVSEGYSIEYIKQNTNIYELMARHRLKKAPTVPLVDSTLEKLVAKYFDHYRTVFVCSELTTELRLLDSHEQLRLKLLGPLAWVNERLNIPTNGSKPKLLAHATKVAVPQNKQPSKAIVRDSIQTSEHLVTTGQHRDSSNADNAGPIDDDHHREPPSKRIRSEPSADAMPPAPGPSRHSDSVIRADAVSKPMVANTQEGYSIEYLREHTNMYEALINRLKVKHPKASLTVALLQRVEMQFYDYFRTYFDQSKMPYALRKLTDDELMEVRTKGPLEWTCERMGLPMIGERQAEVPAETLPAPAIEVRQLDRSSSQTVAEEQPIHQRVTLEQTEQRAVVQQKRPKRPGLFSQVCPIRPQAILYENESPPQVEAVTIEPISGSIAYATQLSKDPLIISQISPSPPVRPTEHVHNNGEQEQSEPTEAAETRVVSQTGPEHNLIAADTFSELNTDNFIPPVCSTQQQATTNSQQEQPQSTEEQITGSVEDIPPGQRSQSAKVPPSPILLSAEPSVTIVKQELTEESLDISDYAGHVQEVPCPPEIYTIEDNSEQLSEPVERPAPSAIQLRLGRLFKSNPGADGQEKSSSQATQSESTAASGCSSYGRFDHFSIKQPENILRKGWPRMVVQKHRTAPDLHFALASTPPKLSIDRPMNCYDFLLNADIDSLRFTNRQIRWPGCNELQLNPLTVSLHHRVKGIFSVSLRDNQVGQLLGLLGPDQQTSAGWEALKAALQHVGKFRYGRNEPSREYYRLPVAEKVLHLFIDSFPSLPQAGGFVLGLGPDRSTFPSHGGTPTLERFDVHLHSQRSNTSTATKHRKQLIERPNDDDGEKFADYLMPGVFEAMKKLRARIESGKSS